jgi:hypothetical protein
VFILVQNVHVFFFLYFKLFQIARALSLPTVEYDVIDIADVDARMKKVFCYIVQCILLILDRKLIKQRQRIPLNRQKKITLIL